MIEKWADLLKTNKHSSTSSLKVVVCLIVHKVHSIVSPSRNQLVIQIIIWGDDLLQTPTGLCHCCRTYYSKYCVFLNHHSVYKVLPDSMLIYSLSVHSEDNSPTFIPMCNKTTTCLLKTLYLCLLLDSGILTVQYFCQETRRWCLLTLEVSINLLISA